MHNSELYYQIYSQMNTANISEIQKSPKKALKDVTIVFKGSEIIGYFFSKEKLDIILKVYAEKLAEKKA